MVEKWKYENENCRLNSGALRNYEFLAVVVRDEIHDFITKVINKYFEEKEYSLVIKAAAYDNSLLANIYSLAKTKNRLFHEAKVKKDNTSYGRVVFEAADTETIEKIVKDWLNYINITVSICVIKKTFLKSFLDNQDYCAKKQIKNHPPENCEMIIFLASGFTDKLKVYYNPKNEGVNFDTQYFRDLIVEKYELY